MFANFTEEARKILVLAKKEMYELKHPYIGSEHLLLAMLKGNNNVSKKLEEYNLDYNTFKQELINTIGVGSTNSDLFLYTPLLKRILESATLTSRENKKEEVSIDSLFAALLEEGEGVAIRIMLGMNIDIDGLYSEFSCRVLNSGKHKKGEKLLLEELGVDLTKKALNNEIDPVIGREKELKRVLEILSRRTKNNPILIGEAGVGKTAIVEELSRMIAFGEVPLSLRNKRIVMLEMAATVAGTKYRGEFEERIKKILKEIEEHDDIIIFIDEIHTLVGAGGAEGAIDASNIFKPALARNKIRCIGATTIEEYKKYIEEDHALDRRFQKVLVDKPSQETVKQILLKFKDIYEQFHKVEISEEIIDLIMELSEKYVYGRNQPDKAIDILDEVCARASLKESSELKKYNDLNKQLQLIINNKNNAIENNNFKEAARLKEEENKIIDMMNNLELTISNKNKVKKVTKEDVAMVVNYQTKIPIYELMNDSLSTIKNIEKQLKCIVGQDEAMKTLLDIIKKVKLGFKDENTVYSLMFCGPTGVGKTYAAKIFADIIAPDNVIKLDMSEYREAHDVSKIIGAPPGYVGYADAKNVFEEIRTKPYAVLILDEIEKAHPAVINLFFQIFDDSKIKDASGRVIRFDNTIIIMTSNVGFIDNPIGFTGNNSESILSKLKENFSMPFINRIDNIIAFKPLNDADITKLIINKLENLKNKYYKKKVKVKISDNIIDTIKKASNFAEFGARRIDKIIKDNVEGLIIDKIIKGNKDIDIKEIKEKTIA